MNSFAEILLIAIFMSAACALPGNFLVLRRMSMLTDAISHTVLLGIVLAFLAVGSLDSPFLIIGASLMGVLTVWLIELLYQSRLVASDSAIGLIFPLLFSVAVILVTRYAGNVHLDTDCILLGELAFAPFDRLIINGTDFGAKGLYTGGAVLILSAAVISLFYKEIKLATFDPVLAGVLGFSPAVIHYGLMSLVSLVAVTSFQSIGSILVIAFMIIPAMTAALWTRTLSGRLVLSCLLGTAGAVLGIIGAIASDSSLAGMMAAVLGVIFHCFPDFRSRHRYPGGFPSAKKTAVRFRTGNASPASSFPCGNERGITGKRSFHPLRPHEMAGKLHPASLPFPLKRRVHHRKKRPPSPHGTRKGP